MADSRSDTPAAPQAPREAWTAAAAAVFLLEVASIAVLVARPPGRVPVLVHYLAPPLLGAAAVLVGSWGFVTVVRRRARPGRGRVFAMLLLALVVATVSYPVPFPARREARPSRVEFRLPLEGEWTVMWGGPETATNLPARARADRRFGYDLVLRVEGRGHAGDGARLADWHAFGRPVLAPSAGTVVRAVDEHSDREPDILAPPPEELGNHVVLEVAPGEYLFLAGLRRGSVRVAVGERVEAGDTLAEVGRSGGARYTREPHLAVHLQDSPDPRWGQGVPFAFRDLEVDGELRERAEPVGRPVDAEVGALGQRVRHVDP